MKPRWSQKRAREVVAQGRSIRREMARAGTLAHHQSEALLHRPLVLPEGADPELGRLFGIAPKGDVR
ncbi:hypothetical protein GCM10022600_15110 [Qipengyuania pelagi]|uniref:Uncharacterized protein n=1 Tax=Qipengyuania pelagi TaxID=994320 RepID=A0A844Y641_9SPHN|nr:hypothetical protein [Qipengyuania pelagi]MXO53634.1 hypothetical protein [Qipengyuania pelagi]